MRLKLLFFPIVLIISVALTIGFIVPLATSAMQKNKENLKMANDLETLRSEKNNIKDFDNMLTEDVEYKKVIYSYLPETKSEERMISGLSHLATISGVSVVSIGLEKNGIDNFSNKAVVNSTAGEETMESAIMQDEDNPEAKNQIVDLVNVDVSVIGSYEKILMFIDQINKMDMYNVINSLKISPQQNPGEDSSNYLVADFQVGFGYMNKLNQGKMVNSSNINSSLSAFDQLKGVVSSTSKTENLEVGAVGKSNPFLP